MFRILALISVLFFLLSCDTGFSSKGFIIDHSTGLPIDNVTIHIKDLDSIRTDSTGKYKIDTLIYGSAGNLEILLKKEGYKTKHVSLRKSKNRNANELIQMEKIENTSDNYCMKKKRVAQMFYFNKYVLSLINIATILFLIFSIRIKRRMLWIFGILLFNLTFFITYTDCSINNFRLINGPVYLTHYWIYPYSVKIVVPLATMTFWLIYLRFRKILLKPQEM